MLRINPFAAIRPQPNLASRVASVPYDVVNSAEARELAKDNPLSFLHVVKPEIDLPPETDLYDDSVYAKARENLDRFIAEGTLIREGQPKLYLYRQVMDHRPQIGIVCCCHIDDYANDLIKKHEKTRREKEDDRTRHVITLNANTGPVFLTYRDRAEIAAMVERDTNARPLYHFDAPDGVTHTVWTAEDPEAYVEAFKQVPCAYVADGHHRSASAARAGAERRQANPDHTGQEEYNWFLTVLFPARQLHILPYNRVVKDLNNQTPLKVLKRLGELGRLKETEDPSPDRPGVFCFYIDGVWHRLEIKESLIDDSDPVGSLDVAVLQDRVLGPIFAIDDPRTSDRIDFVGGIRGTGELEKRVNSGDAAAGISLHPTTIDQLLNVADAGLIMPPKSTWFEPKLRSGLFVHSLD
ncbi:MAG: DUF1015 domain-containing protein [Phycisphaerales bacterium]|nr:MAG: DUF1015 domain-containing protein [Phycisphaerales bacterium]